MFKEQLKELRNQKKITQDELAKTIFVSRSAICKWELGKGFPSEVNIKALCEYFEVSRDFLLDEKDSKIINESKKDYFFKIFFSILGIVVPILLIVFSNIDIFKNIHNAYDSGSPIPSFYLVKRSINDFLNYHAIFFVIFFISVIVFFVLNLIKIIRIKTKIYNLISYSLTITCVLLFIIMFTIAAKNGSNEGWYL